MNASNYRKGLPPISKRIAALPIDARGYPTPWFVETMPDGTRDFRIASAKKRVQAVKHGLCWICGQKMGINLTFPIGPMCCINRTTSEPPSHLGCAEFAVKACPFLLLPQAQYREAALPAELKSPGGIALDGNPGVLALWTTRSFKPFKDNMGGWLIEIGEPEHIEWWTQGRQATRAEVLGSIDRRIPALYAIAEQEGHGAVEQLNTMRTAFELAYLPT